MSYITTIDTESACLVYHETDKIVHHTIRKPLSSAEFRALLTQGTELLIKHSAQKWLSDDRGNGPISHEDTKWSLEEWVPGTLQAGWKYWALVVPDDIKARIGMADFITSYWEKGLRIMLFADTEDAMKWLNKF